MQRKHVFTAVAAFLALGLAPAWAKKDGTAKDEAHRADKDDRRGLDWNRGNARQSNGHNKRFRDYDREAYYQPERDERRGAGPDRRFYRGDRLPVHYRDRRYVVDDWQGHRLSPPPRGYHWVQSGSDYLLVAIATGIIVQLLLAR